MPQINAIRTLANPRNGSNAAEIGKIVGPPGRPATVGALNSETIRKA